MRGLIRSTWPRPNAPATSRRSRVCSGGSFSIIWWRCSALNGAISSAGSQSAQMRPNARSRSTRLTASWVVASQRSLGSCHSIGPALRSSARAGYGSATKPGSARSSRQRFSRSFAPKASGSTSAIVLTPRRRRELHLRPAVLPEQLAAAPARHQSRRRCGRRRRSRPGARPRCRAARRRGRTPRTGRAPYDAFSTLQPEHDAAVVDEPGRPHREVRVRRVGPLHHLRWRSG